ncbi:hypothetical protein D5018_19265 [Parashewanella curva]|uniref:Uncharacterized protein n=1 Tax=Parashewanella curva TaxID=2338552 RepID=A0A3L8PRN9_9GAMM|nr:hypothetical protein [Parashewanella curva]RLV58061.1 hypothetical protein D5018_19265 [Parashewanella curva]
MAAVREPQSLPDPFYLKTPNDSVAQELALDTFKGIFTHYQISEAQMEGVCKACKEQWEYFHNTSNKPNFNIALFRSASLQVQHTSKDLRYGCRIILFLLKNNILKNHPTLSKKYLFEQEYDAFQRAFIDALYQLETPPHTLIQQIENMDRNQIKRFICGAKKTFKTLDGSLKNLAFSLRDIHTLLLKTSVDYLAPSNVPSESEEEVDVVELFAPSKYPAQSAKKSTQNVSFVVEGILVDLSTPENETDKRFDSHAKQDTDDTTAPHHELPTVTTKHPLSSPATKPEDKSVSDNVRVRKLISLSDAESSPLERPRPQPNPQYLYDRHKQSIVVIPEPPKREATQKKVTSLISL